MTFYSRSLTLPALVASIVSLTLLTPALGQTLRSSPSESGWRFQLTPYIWMAGLNGHVQPFHGAPKAHVHRTFSDIWNGLDATFFLTGSARKGDLVRYGDLNDVSTSDDAKLPLGLPAHAKARQTAATLLGGRKLQLNPQSSLDLMGGLRLWDIRAQVRVPGIASAQSSTSFADPILAARWLYDFAPKWSSLLYIDAGGLGVGSRFTWQVHGALNYQWTKNVYLSAGYRYLSVDYRDKGKHLDFSQGGPMLGATFRF